MYRERYIERERKIYTCLYIYIYIQCPAGPGRRRGAPRAQRPRRPSPRISYNVLIRYSLNRLIQYYSLITYQ